MSKQEIVEIQNRILDLAPNRSGIYLKYCCSEISRLIIKWFWDYNQSYEFYILKGTSVENNELSHDILVVKKDEDYLIIDPTIWQFFSNAKTIVIYKGNNLGEGIKKVQQKYKCNWVLGGLEEIPDHRAQVEYLKIINSIIDDNIEESIL